MRLLRGACGALLLVLSIASGASANFLQGTLFCDSDFSRTFTPGDTPLDGVKVSVTAQTALPGQTGDDISGDAIPSPPAVPGFYKVFLPARLEDWKVVLPGPGLPAGASVILPATGFYLAHIDPSSSATDKVFGLDFLIDCNPPPLCTGDASCDDHDPCTDDHCDPRLGCSHTNNTSPCDDGNPCSTSDVCADGQCQPGPPLPCDDGNPCNGIEICVPGVGCQPGPPPYLAKTEARFGNLSTITADIGANDVGGRVRLGRGAHMADNTDASGDTVSISNAASIFKALTNKLSTGAGAVVRDGTTSPAIFPLQEPFCVIPELTCGSPDVIVGARADGGVLAPGSYGRLVMAAGASLTLAGGEYHFCSVKSARGVDILVKGASTSTIDVVGNFLIGDLGTIHVDGGTPLPIVRVGGTAVRFGSNSNIFVNLLAPAANLTIGRTGHLSGTFCFATSRTDKSITLDCPPPPPAP